VVERLNDILDESRTRVPRNTNRAELSLSGHASILRAVEKGDSGAALKAMEKHLLQVEAAL
jgi:DNA-binding FadR family transcriptional regulator